MPDLIQLQRRYEMDKELDPKESDSASENTPQIFKIEKGVRKHKFSRREFVEAAAITATGLSIAGCNPSRKTDAPSSVPPTAVPRPTDTEIPTETKTPIPTSTNTPVPTYTFTPTQFTLTTKIKNPTVNFRTGPSTTSTIIGTLQMNVPVFIIGRLPDTSWLKVRVNIASLPKIVDRSLKDVEGWVRTDMVDVLGLSLKDLPVVQAPPTPTALPNKPISPGGEGIQYKYTDPYGNVTSYTLPCGSPIPAGAICTCNCVTVCSCVGYVAESSPDSGGDTICTCDLVSYWYPN
jgi:hypothetical protein